MRINKPGIDTFFHLQYLFSRSFLFIIIVSTLTISCNTCNHSHEKVAEIKPKQISNINFFLETSASMEGYLRGGSEFSKIIPNLLVEIENRINAKNKAININYISDAISKYPKTTREFIHDISTTDVAKSKSSEMHKIFEMVTNKTDSSDISILHIQKILSFLNHRRNYLEKFKQTHKRNP